jgi:hypothetical protein
VQRELRAGIKIGWPALWTVHRSSTTRRQPRRPDGRPGHDRGMLTIAAVCAERARTDAFAGVAHRDQLRELGFDAHHIDAHVAAGRWFRIGPAVILHNGPQTLSQRRQIALINCGPRAILTAFTALEDWGLAGWSRPDVHVLAPAGTTHPRLPHLVLHRTGNWSAVDAAPARRLHRVPASAVLAASSFRNQRSACGILAAVVQQGLTRPAELRRALEAAPRVRHRAAMLLAVDDIAQGADALSEIDLRRLCARFGLPLPTHQAVRVEPNGRRRYLDAEWRLPDGRVVAVEVDGAYHVAPRQWIEDQLRQNQIVLGGTIVLRFPSIVVRDHPALVIEQLRCLLLPRS